MLTAAQRIAYREYRDWCEQGYDPDISLAQSLVMFLGYMLDMTDGVPDADERGLMGLLMSKGAELKLKGEPQ